METIVSVPSSKGMPCLAAKFPFGIIKYLILKPIYNSLVHFYKLQILEQRALWVLLCIVCIDMWSFLPP